MDQGQNQVWGCRFCGKTFPAGMTRCPYCGQQFDTSGAPKQANMQPAPKARSGAMVGALIVGVAILVLGVKAVAVMQQLKDKPEPTRGMADIIEPTRSVTKGFEPQLQAAPTSTSMPPDVKKWLEHLQGIENERAAAAMAGIMDSMLLMTMVKSSDLQGQMSESGGNPGSQFTSSVGDMKQEWDQINSRFLSEAPPAECRPLADAYQPVLTNTASQMMTTIEAVQQAWQTPDKAQDLVGQLQQMQGKSTESIDAPAQTADRLLGEICKKYSTDKWFSINADFKGAFGGVFGPKLEL